MKALRVASLLAAGTEILYGLGQGEQVVAVSHECDFPIDVQSKPRVTSSLISGKETSAEIDARVHELTEDKAGIYRIDADLLESLAPDVIVTQAHCDVCAVNLDDVVSVVQRSESLRHTKIVALNASTLDDVFTDIRRVADAMGCASAADEYVTSLRNRVDAVARVASEIPQSQRPRVVCIEWIDPLIIAANWMPELIDLAGGLCGITDNGARSGYTDWNEVRTFDPEVVVVMPCGFDLDRTITESTVLKSLPGWHDTAASKTDRVFAVDGNAFFNRSGPRIVDSLEILAHLTHPDLFPDAHARPLRPWQRLSRSGNAS